MSLLDMQRQFRAFLIDEPSAIGLYAADDEDAGLAVYHHAYRAQLEGCLRETFERTWAWLGDEAFTRAIRGYIETHPPASWTISDYGAEFPDTLHAIYPDQCEVGELAALDWTLRRAFDGPNASLAPTQALEDIDWDKVHLHFVPTLRVFPVRTNCGAIWTAISAGSMPPAAHILPDTSAIRVWRVDLTCHFQTVDELEAHALAYIANGASFAELCANVATVFGEQHGPTMAGDLLASWLKDGIIAAIE